jgi:tetratricopeptide (TPR) repeat protein
MIPAKDVVNNKYYLIVICLFLILSTLIAYWQLQHHDFINFDDEVYVVKNYHVQDGISIKSIKWAFTAYSASNWHPLTWLSHMLDYQLYGLKPAGHHLTSRFLHIINVLLLFVVFIKATNNIWQSSLIAALFAIHPVHVESVAWVAERKDLLSTFFWLLTLWFYIKYVEHRSIYRYFPVLLFFAFGLMSKPMVVTLPCVLLLLDYWPLNRFRASDFIPYLTSRQHLSLFSLIIEKIPLFILSAISCVITFYAQKYGGAVASLDFIPYKIRISNAIISYINYLINMFWPFNLGVFYPYPEYFPFWKIMVSLLILISITFFSIKLKQKPFFLVGWLWYLGTMVPVIGIIQVGSQSMADRYTYIPSIGISIIIAWGVPEIFSKFRYKRPFLLALTSVFLFLLMILTWIQVSYWKNSISLFKHTIRVTEKNYTAYNSLGVALASQDKFDDAILNYKHALCIKPDYTSALNNLGNALENKGHYDEAIKHYLKVIEIDPNYVGAYLNIGNIMQKEDRFDEAISNYKKALSIEPEYIDAYHNLGVAFYRKGDFSEAINCLQEALRINPNNTNTKISLKRLYEIIDYQ